MKTIGETLAQTWKRNRCYEALGDVYWVEGKPKKAIKLFRTQAKIFEKLANQYRQEGDTFLPGGAVDRYIDAARAYEKGVCIEEAIHCYEEALRLLHSPVQDEARTAITSKIKVLRGRLEWIVQVIGKSSGHAPMSNRELLRPIRIEY